MPSLACRLALVALPFLACAEPSPRADSTTTASAPIALLEAPDESFANGAVTINYRSIGNGEPILLVHGYGDNLKMWTGIADSLATTFRVIAMDARGFGKSSKPAGRENYGLAMVDDMAKLLDHVGAPRAHLVGYSMGAMLAGDFALLHPDRVASATFAAGGFLEDRAAMRTLIDPWVQDLLHGRRLVTILKQVVPVLPDSSVRTFSDQIFAESDSAALVGSLQSFEDLTLEGSKVATAKVPALAIVGADDPLLRYTRALGQKWPGAKVVEIPATDHMTIPASPQLLEEIRTIVRANPVVLRQE